MKFVSIGLLAGGAFTFGLSMSAFAHEGLQHACHDENNQPVPFGQEGQCCFDPRTNNSTNEKGYPYCPAYLDTIPGGENYAAVDRSALAHTHVCPAGVNCGPPAELSNVQTFYGDATPGFSPAPSAPTPIPASVATVAPPPVAPSALPPVGQIPGASLAGAPTNFVPLLAAAAPYLAGAAGVAGVAAAAAAGGGSSTPSTN